MATKTKEETVNLTKLEIRYVPEDLLAEVFMKVNLGKPGGYLPVEKLVLVDVPAMEWTHCPPSHPNNLNKVFSEYQRVESSLSERVEQLGIRSMSVGDCIIVDEKPYWVSADGFVTADDSGNIVPVA